MASQAEFSSRGHSQDRAVHVALWIAQITLAALFVVLGALTIFEPTQTLAEHLPWTAYVGPVTTRIVGLVEVAGGLGLLAAALMPRRRRLAVFSAIAVATVMFLGFAYHLAHFEYRTLPMDVVLIALAVFVVWGRSRSELRTPVP